jgi:hypothetical protein
MGAKIQLDRQKNYLWMYPLGCCTLYYHWGHGLGSELHDTAVKDQIYSVWILEA